MQNIVESVAAVLEINKNSHTLMSLSYFPHKTRLIPVAAGCHMDHSPLIPPQPWECMGSGGKRSWINWRHQARDCDYLGLVCKAATELCSIPSPRVALCLSWVTAIRHLWLSSKELPAWNWASLQATAAAHGALFKLPCSHFFFFISQSKMLSLSRRGKVLTTNTLNPPCLVLFRDMQVVFFLKSNGCLNES